MEKNYLLANARSYDYKASALILKSIVTRRHIDWVIINILTFILRFKFFFDDSNALLLGNLGGLELGWTSKCLWTEGHTNLRLLELRLHSLKYNFICFP